MQSLLKELDELNISADKSITKQFEPDGTEKQGFF